MTTTREQLERIPDLAAEVWLTRDAPNPDGRVERHPLVFESRPPLDVGVLDALRPIDPDGTSETPLWHLAQAVRVAWDEMRDAGEDVTQLPAPAERPTYASEAGWLLATIGTWELVADPAALGYIASEIGECYRTLQRLDREPRPVRLRCPLCSDVLRVQGGDWLRCDSGHEYAGASRLLTEAWPTGYVVAQFKITEERLRKWHERGKIQPLKEGVKPLYWRPPDVLRALETDGRAG